MKIKDISKKNIQLVFNGAAVIFYVLFVMEAFLKTTTFRIQWPALFHDVLRVLLVVLIIAKLYWEENRNIREFIFIVVLSCMFLLAGVFGGYQVLYDFVLLMLALKDVSLEDIVRVFLISVLTLLMVTVIFAVTGRIDNLIYHFSGRRSRISFGICYPTDFASYFFWLSLAWIYLRKYKLTIAELLGIAAAGMGVWYFCDARLSTLCLFGVAAVFAFVKYRRLYMVKKNHQKEIIPRWMGKVMICMPVVCACVIILLSYSYRETLPLLGKLNQVLSNRLMLGRMAFDLYDVSLFGQHVNMTGYGASTLYQLITDYFFIDCGYINILMCYGIIVFGCILFIYTYASARAFRKKDWILLVIISVIAVNAMIEHHLFEICYNPFLFILLSDSLRPEQASYRLSEREG